MFHDIHVCFPKNSRLASPRLTLLRSACFARDERRRLQVARNDDNDNDDAASALSPTGFYSSYRVTDVRAELYTGPNVRYNNYHENNRRAN